jgi:hypothetical protein
MYDSFRSVNKSGQSCHSALATPDSASFATLARPKWCPRPATIKEMEEQRQTVLARNPGTLALRDKLDREEREDKGDQKKNCGIHSEGSPTAPHVLLCLKVHCEDFRARLVTLNNHLRDYVK